MSEPTTLSTGRPAEPQPNSTLTVIGLVVIGAVAIVVVMLRWRGAETLDTARSHVAVGAPMDDIQLGVLTGPGGPTLGYADLKGKVVLISFWGTWCEPCMQEFPHLVKIAENLKSRDDFRWLPVAYGNAASSAEELRRSVEEFLAKNQWQVATYHDPDESLATRAAAVGAYRGGIPLTILLDRRGMVHAVWSGFREGNERQIEKAVMELLDEK